MQRAAFSVERGGEALGFAAELRGRAEELLAVARAGAATRDTAITLLAADALMTLVCEWTAEMAPERLGALE
jgi:hypothetical protein